MLVLSRQVGQSIMIGDDIEVMVTQCTSGKVRLSFAAPDDVRIDRREIFELRQAALTTPSDDSSEPSGKEAI